jgi:vacuolar-type H+-ATPase subunit H
MEEDSVFKEIESLKQMLHSGKAIPLSKFVAVDKDAFISKIDRIRELLPEEVKEAYLVSKRKNAILAQANEERDRILESAMVRRDEIVQDSDILEEAKKEKAKILNEARMEVEKMQKDAEDYVFKLLSKTQTILHKAQSVLEEGKKGLKYESPDSEHSE